MRTQDLELFLRTMKPYLDDIAYFDPEEWLSDPDNIALTNDNEDLALFDFNSDGIYTGHYFFNSRGKEAYNAAQDFLKEIFTDYNLKVIRGYTPLDKKGALWMNKKLGFTEYGNVETHIGPCRLVFLTKLEWATMNKETQ